MIVALEASAMLAPRPTGVGMYGRGLAGALWRKGVPDVVLIYPAGRWARRRSFREAGMRAPFRAYFSGRSLERRCSLVHALDTRIPRSYRGPLVVTVHDTLASLALTAALGLASASFREKKERAYRLIADRAHAIITLSEAVRDEFAARYPTRADVVVIPPGVDAPRDLSRDRAAEILAGRGVSPPFLLAVGALCPRKNMEASVRALLALRRERPGLRLLLAGEPAYGWEGSAGERAVAAAGDAVVSAGYLSREELWAAYTLGDALVHLSHYEGYGLTVAEALSAGTPVVASRRGGIPEAAAGAGWLVDPDDPGEVEAAVRRVLEKGDGVEARRRLGLSHARELTWERAAERVEEVYRAALHGAEDRDARVRG